MEKKFDFDTVGKRTPYTVPDGFFEKMQQQVAARVAEQPQRKRQSHKRLIIAAVAAMAAVLTGWLFAPPSLPVGEEQPVAASEWMADGSGVGEGPDEWIENLSDEELEELVSLSENDVFLN